MNFLRFGESDKFIVFLHGWGADKNSFIWLKNYFQNYSLIFVDFQGFGESSEPQKPMTVFDYVLSLKELLDNFQIKSLVLVGHSFGGRVAIKFSFLFQNDYDDFKLCLVDSAGILPRRSFKYYIKVGTYKICKRIFKNAKFLSKFGSSDYVSLSPVMKQTFINVVNEDLSTYASGIRAETLIVWGENDMETKMYMAKKLHKLISNSTLYIISGAGHFSFLHSPSEFAIILDSFVKSN